MNAVPNFRNLVIQDYLKKVYSYEKTFLPIILVVCISLYSCIKCYNASAVAPRKSKVELVMIAASCGAFFLLLLGAAFTYRRHQLHKFKNEVFVDVAGI